MDGLGKMFFADGTVYEGSWKNNKMHGKGICWRKDGSTYKGEYMNDKR